jgi:putative phosphoesterase
MRKFLAHHIVGLRSLADGIRERIARELPDVVVFGHTHQPHEERRGKTLFINPGYAGKPRFGMERSVALLHCAATGLLVEFLPLK